MKFSTGITLEILSNIPSYILPVVSPEKIPEIPSKMHATVSCRWVPLRIPAGTCPGVYSRMRSENLAGFQPDILTFLLPLIHQAGITFDIPAGIHTGIPSRFASNHVFTGKFPPAFPLTITNIFSRIFYVINSEKFTRHFYRNFFRNIEAHMGVSPGIPSKNMSTECYRSEK